MNKLKKNILLLAITTVLILIPIATIYADVDYGGTSTSQYGRCNSDQLSTVFGCVDKGKDSLVSFVRLTFNWVAGLISGLAVLGIIWAAYTYSTSVGNPDSIAKAKDIIFTSISSVVIIIFSWAFFKLLGVV